jgi:hypothetical protein
MTMPAFVELSRSAAKLESRRRRQVESRRKQAMVS